MDVERLENVAPEFVERFWGSIKKTDTCWLWAKHLNPSLYGEIKLHGHTRLAHRISYLLLVGPIVPKSLTVDHICRVRHCVRPEHLRLLSNVENIMVGEGFSARNARKTHCPYGHQLDLNRKRAGRPNSAHRVCSICVRRHARESYERHRDTKNARRREKYKLKRATLATVPGSGEKAGEER